MDDKDELVEKAIAWLRAQGPAAPNCFVCGKDEWSVQRDLIELRPYTGGGLVVGGPVYPALQIVCTTCGQTVLFNAVVAGLVPPADTEGQATEATP